MAAINYSELRNNLKEMMDRACNDHESLIVSRKNHADVVMLSLEDYESLKETAYLLRSPANAKRTSQVSRVFEAAAVPNTL